MTNSKRPAQFFAALVLGGALLAAPACHRSLSASETKERADLRRALREHSFAQATTLARQIVERHPSENGAWDRLVQAQAGGGDVAGARRTLEEWRRGAHKPAPKLDEYEGDLAWSERDGSRALQHWTNALSLAPKHARLLGKVARLEQTQQHWPEAINAWTTLLAVRDQATARTERALCRRHLHHWDEALEDLHRAQELAPDDPEVLHAAKLFGGLSKYLAEIKDLDARLLVAPNDAASLTDRALLFLRGGDAELALEDSAAAAKLAPRAVRPKLFQGLSLLALGRPNECETLGLRKATRLDAMTAEFLETVSRLDADISVEQTNAELYVARAWQLNDLGQPTLALVDAENAAKLDPQSASAHVEASYALRKLGRAPEAYNAIKHATELDPNLATAWQYRGELEIEHADFLTAVDSLSRALTANQTAVALFKREACYRHLGLLAKAEEDHRAIQELTARALK